MQRAVVVSGRKGKSEKRNGQASFQRSQAIIRQGPESKREIVINPAKERRRAR